MTNVVEDQEDDALNRWKASLGISSSPALPVDPSDKRRCVIHTLALEVEGRPDITIDLTTPGALEALKKKPFSIKEGAQFRMKVTFKVQHDVLSGLKYLQVVKRKGFTVGKDEEMLVHSSLDPLCPYDQLSQAFLRRARTHHQLRRSLSMRRNVNLWEDGIVAGD